MNTLFGEKCGLKPSLTEAVTQWSDDRNTLSGEKHGFKLSLTEAYIIGSNNGQMTLTFSRMRNMGSNQVLQRIYQQVQQ